MTTAGHDDGDTAPEHDADFDALDRAAAAMRRLNRAVAGRRASDHELALVASEADRLAALLEAHERRDKAVDMAAALGLDGGFDAPEPPAVGAVMEFDPLGLGGGRLNPASVDVRFVRDTDTSVTATMRIDGMFQGPPNRVHGGMVALLFDELMGAVNRATGRRAFTVRLTVNLRAAAPIDEPLTMRAWLDHVDGRKITIRAEGHSAAGLFADADGLFISFAEFPA